MLSCTAFCILGSFDLLIHRLAGSFPVFSVVDSSADDDDIRSLIDHGIKRLHVDAARNRYLGILYDSLYSVQFIQRVVVIGLGILGRVDTDIVDAGFFQPSGSSLNILDTDKIT